MEGGCRSTDGELRMDEVNIEIWSWMVLGGRTCFLNVAESDRGFVRTCRLYFESFDMYLLAI